MDEKMYKEFVKTQNTHWWFVGRRNILLSLLEHASIKKGKVLDIGCGMGVMLQALEQFGDVYGTDFEDISVEYCRSSFGAGKIAKGSLPDNIPFDNNTFSLITCLDVIEHIEDDAGSISKIYDLLEPGGTAMIAVPALKCMWGYNDVMSHHKRRYNKKELLDKISKTKFEVVKCSYFNFLLFPMAFIVRKVKAALHIEKPDLEVAGKQSIVNTILTKLFTFEKFLLSKGDLPYGVSLVAIVKKCNLGSEKI